MSKLAHVCAAYSKLRPSFDAGALWNELVKRTIGRFARGNIAAQNRRVLLPNEQAQEHRQSRELAKKWKERYKAAA
jgi:hypothetical protein